MLEENCGPSHFRARLDLFAVLHFPCPDGTKIFCHGYIVNRRNRGLFRTGSGGGVSYIMQKKLGNVSLFLAD